MGKRQATAPFQLVRGVKAPNRFNPYPSRRAALRLTPFFVLWCDAVSDVVVVVVAVVDVVFIVVAVMGLRLELVVAGANRW